MMTTCFLLFRKNDHVSKYYDHFNLQHTNIEFTVEIEQDNSLPFLDVQVKKSGNAFVTDFYRILHSQVSVWNMILPLVIGLKQILLPV